ncbi:MAG: 2-dehydro-3-deoxygluconokinase [Spirochaetales bacterium]
MSRGTGLSSFSPQWAHRTIDILAYGEPLVGFYPMGEGTNADGTIPLKTPWMATWGGDTSNLVLAASKLGLSCAYLSRIGEDPFGEGFLSLWETSGIRTDFIQKDPQHPTGLYFVSFHRGKHVLTYYRKDSAAAQIDPDSFDPSILSSIKILHLSGISLAISQKAREFGIALMEAARRYGTLVSFDTNYRPALLSREKARYLFEELIPSCVHVLATTDEEMEFLEWGKDPNALPAKLPGPIYYLIKQGPKGVYVRSSQEEILHPAYTVPVVDTVGAGDAFDAGFLRALLHGEPLGKAVQYASAVAALVCTGQGPLEKQPSHQEVEAFLAQKGKQ